MKTVNAPVRLLWWVLALTAMASASSSLAQMPPTDAPPNQKPARDEAPGPAAKVEVRPEAPDTAIRDRLLGILKATGWFKEPTVSVLEGVVFLGGETSQDQYRQWAGELARNTRDVVAVVNRVEVSPPSIWDFSAAEHEMVALGRSFLQAVPLLIVGLFVLVIARIAAGLTTGLTRRVMARHVRGQLLREVVARAGGILIFLLGLYLVLRVAGLTRLALSVIGGTGLVGLVLGIAFRDITENFLASIFLSLQQPFREGDLVDIAGTTGFVQRLNSRTTILMTLEGNQIQVPNSTVFKSTICNYTSNPNRREDFTVGIGYDAVVPDAQEIALGVLADHPAVLKEPEPWVLVDSLEAATVNLRVYFWLDGSRNSWLKVRSSVIRLVKRAFQDAGISLPDEAREVVFPQDIPVRIIQDTTSAPGKMSTARPEPDTVSTLAEGGLHSEAEEIAAQGRQTWLPAQGENLLTNGPHQTPGPERQKTTR